MLTSILLGAAVFLVYLVFLYDNGNGGFAHRPSAPRAKESRASGTLETVHFRAHDGAQLEGWLMLPRRAHAPLVLMAPGLTGTKDGFLEDFGWQFVERGFGALLLDYRTFGGSEGHPRHWVDLGRHREDYEAALDYARNELARRGVIDPQRIVLWGSSFSGGTVLVVAAARPDDVAAVIAQAPYLATPPSQQPSTAQMARYFLWTTLDIARDAMAHWLPWKPAPIYITAFGQPGEFAFARSRENPSLRDWSNTGAPFWKRLPQPPRGGWENKMLARFLADLDRFTPMDHVGAIRCPALLIAAKDDDLVPPEFVSQARERLQHPASRMSVLDSGHFDLYVDEVMEKNVALQVAFLEEITAADHADRHGSESAASASSAAS